MDPNVQFYEKLARFYEAEHLTKTDDLPLYSELADEVGDPILDVGCGTGRITLALAKEGHNIIGLDHSEQMLARGRRALDAQPKLKPFVTFKHGDALAGNLGEAFKMILVSYNSFTHFRTQAAQLSVLRHCAEALDPDGWLVIDLPNAGEIFATQDDNALTLERMFTEPESGHMVMQYSVSTLNHIDQYLNVTWIYDEIGENGAVQRTLAPLTLRCVFPGEMELMLAAAGLRLVAFYGDYDQSDFEEGCPRMIVLAEKEQESA